jgi:hypothetical protein
MYSIILNADSSLAEKQQHLFHYLAQFGFQNFLKIESVISNRFYGQVRRHYHHDNLLDVSIQCQSEDFHDGLEEVNLMVFASIAIPDLVNQMNDAHLILINFNETIRIVNFRTVENLNCFFF